MLKRYKEEDGVTEVVIPDSVKEIEDFAFEGCISLTSITIPSSVTTIRRCVFSDCSSLISITIPDSVTAIGKNAFNYCENLQMVQYGIYTIKGMHINITKFKPDKIKEMLDTRNYSTEMDCSRSVHQEERTGNHQALHRH